MALECTIAADEGSLLVAVAGRLGLGDVAPLRERLLKCLAEQPEALLIELSGLTVGEPLALAVFTAVLRQAARWPGIPVLFCAPGARTRELMSSAAYHRLPMFRSTADARNHLRAGRETLPWISDEVLPVSGAARQARNVATDACLRWDLPHLVGPASLIVSELVSNVVDHAHTMADIRISLRRRYLTIAVRDGASAPPVASDPIPAGDISAGRGLLLVDATAHSWGWLPSEGGKVVWAALAR